MVHRLTKGYDLARGIVPQPGGSLVVAAESGGYLKPFHGPDALLLRLRPDGTRDRTFGQGGALRVSIGRGEDHVSGVASLSGGQLVAGGVAWNLNADAYNDDGALYAFRAQRSGRLDPTFGRGGIVSARVPKANFHHSLSGIAVSPDGSVVVGGTTEAKRLTLARFDSRGRLDKQFGGDGIVFHRVQYPYALSRQPDGRLLVVGMTYGSGRDWFVLRLRRDGTRDPAFGRNGLVVTSFGKDPDSAHAVAVDSRGRIVVAGYTLIGDVNCTIQCMPLRLVRYLPNGRLDSSFGKGGRVESEIGLAHEALGVAFQRDGDILVAGSSHLSERDYDPQLAIWRFDVSGRRDRTFGIDGVLAANPTTGRINFDILTQVTVQPDGRIVAGGGAAKPTTGFDGSLLHDVAVLRAR